MIAKFYALSLRPANLALKTYFVNFPYVMGSCRNLQKCEKMHVVRFWATMNV